MVALRKLNGEIIKTPIINSPWAAICYLVAGWFFVQAGIVAVSTLGVIETGIVLGSAMLPQLGK
ncbi:MAG: hypothetical protein ACRC30_15340 [Clostridium sp.]